MRSRAIKIGAAVVLAALAGGGVAWATAGDERDESVTGTAAERARAAALAHTGAGQVTGVERDSDGGAAWEVEVVRSDGSTSEVVLDERYGVVGVERDDENADDGAGDAESDDDEAGE
ncbi:MAG: hypothetical protein ACRDPC_21155 [Solirubrobacteraceae bacterium]